MEDKLLDNNHWNKMQPVSTVHSDDVCDYIACPKRKKNSARRKIEFLLVSIDSKRTNSTRDCIYRRSKAGLRHIGRNFGQNFDCATK